MCGLCFVQKRNFLLYKLFGIHQNQPGFHQRNYRFSLSQQRLDSAWVNATRISGKCTLFFFRSFVHFRRCRWRCVIFSAFPSPNRPYAPLGWLKGVWFIFPLYILLDKVPRRWRGKLAPAVVRIGTTCDKCWKRVSQFSTHTKWKVRIFILLFFFRVFLLSMELCMLRDCSYCAPGQHHHLCNSQCVVYVSVE